MKKPNETLYSVRAVIGENQFGPDDDSGDPEQNEV